MIRVTQMLSAAVLVLTTGAAVHAQQRPDFTGTWHMDMSRSESAAQSSSASPHMPVIMHIRQSAGDLTIETDRDGTTENVRYVFGRAETPQAVGTSGSDQPTIEPAGVEWRGDQLVTTTVYRVNKMPVKQVRTHRLAADGREMVVETRIEMEHGYESDNPAYKSSTTAKDVYTRVGAR
jgi:hypothetical protein